jgi:hypothetical protein
VSDIVAVNNHVFLVDERDGNGLGNITNDNDFDPSARIRTGSSCSRSRTTILRTHQRQTPRRSEASRRSSYRRSFKTNNVAGAKTREALP